MDQQEMANLMQNVYMQTFVKNLMNGAAPQFAPPFAQFETESADSDDDLDLGVYDYAEDAEDSGGSGGPDIAPLGQSSSGTAEGVGATNRTSTAAKGEVSAMDFESVMRVFRQRDGPRACPATCFSDGAHLCAASRQGNLGMIKAFVELLAVPVNTQDICGRTALHIASMYGHLNVVRYLLDRGMEVDSKDNICITPLLLAAWNNRLDVVKTLIKRGADVNASTRSEDHMKDNRAPLHFACEAGHLEMCRYLVKNGGKVNAATTGGVTPLHVASGQGQADLVNFLLDSGADVRATTVTGSTPQEFAAFFNNYQIFLLLQQRAS